MCEFYEAIKRVFLSERDAIYEVKSFVFMSERDIFYDEVQCVSGRALFRSGRVISCVPMPLRSAGCIKAPPVSEKPLFAPAKVPSKGPSKGRGRKRAIPDGDDEAARLLFEAPDSEDDGAEEEDAAVGEEAKEVTDDEADVPVIRGDDEENEDEGDGTAEVLEAFEAEQDIPDHVSDDVREKLSVEDGPESEEALAALLRAAPEAATGSESGGESDASEEEIDS